MPVIKSKAKAKNLGAYSVKRKGVETQQQDEGPPRKRPRASSPAPGSADGSSESDDAEPTGAFVLEPYGEDVSESDGEDDPGVDVHEENDIPHPKDYTDLVQWLKLSDEHLASFHTSAAPAQRGSYHSTKELRKAEKERAEREQKEDVRHGLKATTIHTFFSRARPVLREPSPLQSNEPPLEIDEQPNKLTTPADTLATHAPSIPDSVPASPRIASPPRARVDDVSDEDSDFADEDEYLSVQVSQLTPEAMAEEGLDDLLWDPSEFVSSFPSATIMTVAPMQGIRGIAGGRHQTVRRTKRFPLCIASHPIAAESPEIGSARLRQEPPSTLRWNSCPPPLSLSAQ
ncbi:hypothetical protein B0H14DRAFT_3875313 [Mycena olivaceomarginata]|nr:hypothetical protein B0H14DRAFT_3875313 [Mycena olivaceomarginata]